MLDLTDHVVAAALARDAWDIGMVRCWWDSGLDVREPFEIIWDSDAGEGWALLVTGGVVWAWRASIAWTLIFALAVGGVGLLVAEYGDVNVHGPAAILMFVVLAAVAVGGLFGLIAIVRLAPHIWRKKA